MKFLRLPDVIARTGLSKSTIRHLERGGTFPQRRRIGARAVAWLESEVDAWIASTRPAAQHNDRTAGAQ